MKAKQIFLALALMCSVAALASSRQVTVTLSKAGTLAAKLAGEQRMTVTSLKVTGPIDGTDVLCLREMAGRDRTGNDTDGQLRNLDLSDARIVGGGDAYYSFVEEKRTSPDTIGDNMFFQCRLQSVVLPRTAVCIGMEAFRFCHELVSIVVPDSVKSIGAYAFSHCLELRSVVLGRHVTEIGDMAFMDSEKLDAVVLPATLRSIGKASFGGCPMKSVTLPDSVESIGESAFGGCSELAKVELGAGLRRISDYAFYGCKALRSVVSNAGRVPECSSEAFQGVDTKACILYVPRQMKADYMKSGVWSRFSTVKVARQRRTEQPRVVHTR